MLDSDPENARAYLGKLMAELHVSAQEDLKDEEKPFDDNGNYQKVLRFGDEGLKATLEGYIAFINNRNEHERLDEIYNRAINQKRAARTEEAYKAVAITFGTIATYRDAAALKQECLDLAESARKDAIYNEAKFLLGGNGYVDKLEQAIALFKTIPDWRDSNEKVLECQQKIERIKRAYEKKRIEDARIARRNKKIAIVSTVLAVLAIAVALIVTKVVIPTINYNDALALMDAGQYDEAIAAFEALDGYKDSTEQITECKYLSTISMMDAGQYYEAIAAFEALDGYKDSTVQIAECKQLTLKNPQISDYVFFGAYEQDNDTSNGKEDIEWMVLEIKDGKALVISKYALDCQQHNTEWTSVTWETCSLRKWLNNEFIHAAFSTEEQAMIPTVTVSADKNPNYSTDPGNATEDQVFLLSITEANKYFASDSARECVPTDYAVANDAYVNSGNGNCWWWLRSPGNYQLLAAYVNYDGGVIEYGNYVSYDYDAVRPALWINLES